MSIKIIECPRDAMQGMTKFIPTEDKIRLLRSLLHCGFDTLDCGSFVSKKHIPQMADTHEVLQAIGNEIFDTKLLVIVANERGAHAAVNETMVDVLGFPFSINETFQIRNTNAGTEDAFLRLKHIHEIATSQDKETVAYISMAFGNPYGDVYNPDDVLHWTEKIAALGIRTISLSDTVGSASIQDIEYLFNRINTLFPEIECGAHFHALPNLWELKIEAAFQAGCRRFDGAMMGFGGCPMAADELTGNIPTEGLIPFLQSKEDTGIHMNRLEDALKIAGEIYI